MNNFTFYTPTRYIFGREAESHVGRLAKLEGWRKVMIVYGGGSAVRSGLLDRVKASLESEGISHVELSGIRPNPTDDRVYEGITVARETNIDALIAVGGGSVIDTAKGIACGVPYEGDFWDFYCGKKVVEKALPVGVVLTIPAAGSEGSGNSVITRKDGLIKLSLRTESALRPKFSCLNPELTFTLPPFQTACGICDMMVHIMERYFTPTENVEVTDRLAEGLLKAIIDQAYVVMSNPMDYDARANIMWSGTMPHKGICGCGRQEDWASHFIEHEISALYPQVAHGAGLAVIVPAWMRFVGTSKPSKVAQFGRRIFGIDTSDDRQAVLRTVDMLKTFFHNIGLPTSISELGIDDHIDIELLVRKLHQNKGEKIGAYIPLSPLDTKAIYELAL